MLKEEKFIEKHFGKGNNFKVPNGYFEGFDAKLKDRLSSIGKNDVRMPKVVPFSAKRSFWIRHRRVVGSIAAGMCISVLSLGAYIHKLDIDNSKQPAVQQAQMVSSSLQHSDNSIDEFVNYTMMDTEDMYSYMADAN